MQQLMLAYMYVRLYSRAYDIGQRHTVQCRSSHRPTEELPIQASASIIMEYPKTPVCIVLKSCELTGSLFKKEFSLKLKS